MMPAGPETARAKRLPGSVTLSRSKICRCFILEAMMLRRLVSALRRRLQPARVTTHRPMLHNFADQGSNREWQQLSMYLEVFAQVKEVPGDVLEFGVGSGTSFKSFVRLVEAANQFRHQIAGRCVNGFDTFTGLPELSPHDRVSEGHTPARDMRAGGFNAAAHFAELLAFCAAHPVARVHKGLFAETVPAFLKRNEHLAVALLHIDCDLYESTKDALQPLFERLAPGGIILFDEIFNPIYPGETKAFWEVYNERSFGARYEFVRVQAMPWKWYLRRK
jgi:hypothetical protein